MQICIYMYVCMYVCIYIYIYIYIYIVMHRFIVYIIYIYICTRTHKLRQQNRGVSYNHFNLNLQFLTSINIVYIYY